MTEHLPECFASLCECDDTHFKSTDCDFSCICPSLRACEQRVRDEIERAVRRERGLWERVAAERIADLKSCHKNDDCHARADSIEVLLDDIAHYREEKP